ncbi:MAG: DNA mismatch repair protein MutS [Bacteroidota bacterium]
MKQYQQVKARYPDTILLFRMGDFFETFEEDARITAQVLGITLTRRGNGAAGEVPLAGFPHHALESYLPKLLKAGHRVAVCEQLEDPKFAKGIVKRDVVEVVTPGIAFSDRVLDQKNNNYLATVALPSAIAAGDDMIGFAYVDISTGEFSAGEIPLRQLAEQIGSLQPSEMLIQKRDLEPVRRLLGDRFQGLITKMEDWIYAPEYGYEQLIRHFQTQSLKGFGLEELRWAVVAAGAVMNYLQETQKSNFAHIRTIALFDVSDHMVLDPSTKRNLEIATTLAGEPGGSLFSVIDRTHTPMGGRLLKKWVNRPLKSVEPIRIRLEAVGELFNNAVVRAKLAEELKPIGDLERLMARIATGRANPRELNQLRLSLSRLPGITTLLTSCRTAALAGIREGIDPQVQLVSALGDAIADDPPPTLAEGGVIRSGYNAELDELRSFSLSGKDWIARMQQEERRKTGISSLKVGYNNVFGYYIEITHTHKEKVPQHYIRKQTLTNAERFITPELKEYEEKILNAEQNILALETRLFNELRSTVSDEARGIQHNAELLAQLDCSISLAEVASANRYTCPQIDDSLVLEIREGRHPVIETLLPPGEHYEPNDTHLDGLGDQIYVITGPNMSGKSSYLRQVGLIVLLAQIGSFVPASSARIGVVDKIFTRVGASDNIASGESTFLVEMHEAAHIVNTATERSLILLDEVGRGTSTFDGISIAWALTEYLHERIGAKTLFATHYHELNRLADLYPRIKNFKVDVREYGDKVIFLHKVLPGFADHSYGIQVAQMAGLPAELTDRAKSILRNLERSELSPGESTGPRLKSSGEMEEGGAEGKVQLTLFEMRDDKIREAIRKVDPNTLTPMEALKLIAELKKGLGP